MTKHLLFGGLLSMSILTVATQQGPLYAQVTPAHVAQTKSIIACDIATDGQYVAYTLAVPADPQKANLPSSVELHVLNTATNQTQVFYSSTSVSQVTFRPGKGTITFITRGKDEKINGLYEMSLHGGEARKIFAHTSNLSSYTWSKDGNKLAFISAEKSNTPKTSLTYAPQFFEEEYPDRNVYIVNNITEGAQATKLAIKGAAYLMDWTPDGKKIAVSVAPTASVDDSYMAQKIKIVDVASQKITAEVDNKGKLSQIAWSPDGNTLAILGAYDLNDPTDGTISVVGINGGKPNVVAGDILGKFESIKWLENGHIHYILSEGTKTSIGTIQPSTGKTNTIFKSAVHHITAFDKASNGTYSFVANSPEHPSELFILPAKKNSQAQRVTNSNPWLNGLKLGKQEVITYKAKDGKFDIEGMLIYPIDYQEGDKVPLITVVHGGPEAHYSNGWLTNYSSPGQMSAAKGYAVFYPNYRGSTGRGTTFTYSSQADLSGREFDDIVDGIDHLINKGLVDEKRVGVTGGSYGGYASAWMSTYYSNRFAAAVMFVGISNNISKFGTSDIPTEMKLVHERGNVWDNWQKQLEISPIYYADRAQTPILIMHGSEDPRVHPAQSMELYRHLKVRKPELPVRLIYYPGEGHGNARSGSRYDYNLRMLQWFDVYLKSGDAKAAMPNLDLPE